MSKDFNATKFFSDLNKTGKDLSDEKYGELLEAEMDKLDEEDYKAAIALLEGKEECDCKCEDKDPRMTELEIEEKEMEIEANKIALVEEIKRVEKQDSEFDIPDFAYDTDIFNEVEAECYAIAHGFRILLDAGVDYVNALSISQSSAVGVGNRKLQQIQGVQMQQNQI